ncbi:uncharacterized protein LOC144110003 [Amblyomma americanum]
MDHILIKWTQEEMWDVYPIRAMVNTAVGFRLLTEPGAIDDVRGTIELFTWKDSEPPAPAEVLDIGKARVLETKRARLASAGLRDEGDVMTESLECSPNEEFCSQCENMRRELDVVKRRNKDLEAAHESQKVLKKLKKMLDDMKSIDAISAVRPCPQHKENVRDEIIKNYLKNIQPDMSTVTEYKKRDPPLPSTSRQFHCCDLDTTKRRRGEGERNLFHFRIQLSW